MVNIALLLICLLSGGLLRTSRLLPTDAHLTLNQLLVTVFIPALTLRHIPDMHLSPQFWLPVLVPWFVFLMGLLFFGLAGHSLRDTPQALDRPTLGSLQLTGGISSVSFVGFPLFELLHGERGLAVGIVMSQAGTFGVAMTLGVALASWHTARHHPVGQYSSGQPPLGHHPVGHHPVGQPSVRKMLGNMLRFPPFPVFLLALAANLAGYQHSALVRDLLDKISAPFTVLALISVGMQLQWRVRPEERSHLLLGLSYKLLLAPLLVFLLCRFWLGRQDYVADLCVIGSAIGPMNTAAILASRYGLNAPLASQMVGIGIPLSFPVLFLIYYLMERGFL
ncbi:AEC family transporter [Spirosoma oryzicola]|uniref:AEC family transporter n=1 Tax=Spirosoma oryzicola TaxID=2898794 RepID=UPI001E53CA28|nr:AEC family transporter [Spirosoma oryzicola]UHG94389.1 transporter [Spirosoma oryzicola]